MNNDESRWVGGGAFPATLVLILVSFKGQHLGLVLATLAVVQVIGWGPHLVWRRVRRKLPYNGDDIRLEKERLKSGR